MLKGLVSGPMNEQYCWRGESFIKIVFSSPAPRPHSELPSRDVLILTITCLSSIQSILGRDSIVGMQTAEVCRVRRQTSRGGGFLLPHNSAHMASLESGATCNSFPQKSDTYTLSCSYLAAGLGRNMQPPPSRTVSLAEETNSRCYKPH